VISGATAANNVKTFDLQWDEMEQYIYMAVKAHCADASDAQANAIASTAVTTIRRHLIGLPSLESGGAPGYQSSPMHDGRLGKAIHDAIVGSSLADGG
jgi:hypothetical protein